MLPERVGQDWISSGRRARMEAVLDAWYARLKSYLPPDAEEDRPVFDLWAKRWIWKPLSGSDFPDVHTDGYFALSYVWGDASAQKEIEVDGKIV